MPPLEPLTWLLLMPTLAYAAAVLAVAHWRRDAERAARPSLDDSELPRAAILVAARNEENTLSRCLEALLAQDYPADRLAIYVADDHSTDGTVAVVRRFQEMLCQHSDAFASGDDPAEAPPQRPQLHLIHVPEATASLRGKALAIHAAIESSSEELLLMTDADCAPPPAWARTMAAYMAEDDVGIITAETTVTASAGGTVAAVEALDWRYLLSCSAFLIENGLPVTAMGNNMAFRRKAYEAAGGYAALPFSVTEDYLLFRSILEKTRWRARFPVDERLNVVTLPLGRLREIYRQRRRWARGGLRAPVSSYLIYAGAYLAHVLPVATLFAASIPALAALALKLAADTTLARAARPGGQAASAGSYLIWQLYLFAYVASLPVALLLAPRIKWKGRRL